MEADNTKTLLFARMSNPLALALLFCFASAAVGCPSPAPEDPPPLDPDEAAECAEDEDCDDRDPCTTGACANGTCVYRRVDAEPKVVGIVPTGGPALDVHLQTTRWLHVATGEKGIESYDLNPLPEGAALLARERPTRGIADGVSFLRDHVIALVGSAGIEAFPAGADTAVSIYRTSGPVRGVTRVDDLIVASVGVKGVEIIDYTDFASPRRLARVNTPGRAERAVRHGSALHVADNLGGVAFIDFRERDAPVLLTERRRSTDGRVMAVSLRPPLFILAEMGAGFGVIDVDQPERDRLALVQLGGSVVDINTLSPHTAIVAASEGGLVLVDLLNPASPRALHRLAFDSPATRISRSGELVAVALGETGVAIVDLACTPVEEN